MKKSHIAVLILLASIGIGIAIGFGVHRQLFSILNPQSSPVTAKPFAPDPAVVQFINAGNPFGKSEPQPWLRPELIDPAKPDLPDNVRVVSKAEPTIEKAGAEWVIKFKMP